MRWTEEDYEKYKQSKGKQKRESIVKEKNQNQALKEALAAPARKSKYNNKKTTIDGIQFDSQKEAEYYCQLKLLKKAGEIRDFGLQPRYELQPTFKKNGTTHRSITYVADFIIDNNDGTTDVVDVKSSKTFKTQVYRIKKKMFEYKYPELTIKEVY